MWIVELALRRPYTFFVISMLIAVISSVFLFITPKDIFPNINIPIVSVIWSYTGLAAEEFAQRVTTYSEYSLSNNVTDIERMESQTVDGIGIIRLFFHPDADIATAIAEATATSQNILRRMPAGMLPPTILRYYVNTVPLIQMILSGEETVDESQLYDYANWRIRQSLATIQGATLPTPFGGKVRQLMVDVDSNALQTRGLSARDVNQALLSQVLTTPLGDSRIGNFDYRVNVNNTPVEPDAFNGIPIASVDNKTIFLRDVAFAHDGFAPQTNIVREDGVRSVLMQVLKNGGASTLDIVSKVWDLLPTIQAAAPKGMDINLIFDQSIFVKKAIEGVVVEGVLAATLTGMMVLVFLGSWRSTLIVLTSIPLSIMTSIIFLSLLGETLNIMTLGGLALAIGILVDDATVAIENIHRNVSVGKPLQQAIMDGSYEVAIPAFVSTLAICIVFLPVVLLIGPSKFLFTPFAMAVIFAIGASYVLSRTLVPVLIKFLLPPEMYLYTGGGPKTALDRYHHKFSEHFQHFRHAYGSALQWCLDNRWVVLVVFGIIFTSAFLLSAFVGEDFFPSVDAGQIRLHVRAPTGTRIEVTEEVFAAVENEIRKIIPPDEIAMLIDNIGLNPVPYSLAFGDSATLGGYDGEILISLTKKRKHSTQEYMSILRQHLKEKFPLDIFFYQPADMVNQILNLGLPTPINVRVMGYDQEKNLKITQSLIEEISHVPGAVDTHMHQTVDFPELFLEMDRMQLATAGLQQIDAVNDILLNFSDSTTITPNFWLDRKAGVPYLIAVQNPKYRINTIEGLLHIPIASPKTNQSQLLCDVCTLERRSTPGVVSHVNIQPVYEIYANVQNRDLGGVASEIQVIIDKYNQQMKPGNQIVMSGVVLNMKTAFTRLGIGFIFAILLVYCLMVINFQSWVDPFCHHHGDTWGFCRYHLEFVFNRNDFQHPFFNGIDHECGRCDS